MFDILSTDCSNILAFEIFSVKTLILRSLFESKLLLVIFSTSNSNFWASWISVKLKPALQSSAGNQ